jgi:hypothetical protein
MRPIYETDADLERESTVAEAFEKAWKAKAVKLPIRYSLDFAFTRQDKVFAFAEIKTRKLPMAEMDRRGGYDLGFSKWIAAKQFNDASGLPFVLIVKLPDGLYYSMFGEGHNSFKPDDIVMGGRVDRNDSQDIEPMVIIRAERFKKLKD